MSKIRDTYDYKNMSRFTLVNHAKAMVQAVHDLSEAGQRLAIENMALRRRIKLIEQHRRVFQEFGK